MRRLLGLAAAGLGLAALTGCGQKGALYLPDAKPQAVTTPAQAPPASDPAAARRKTPPAPDPATTQ